MIYTVTFNPSLDYIVTLEKFNSGMVNRTQKEQMLPGGKGINVSFVLKNMGIETTALGFISGFTGKEIERRLKKSGCLTDFIELDEGFSRINVKVWAEEESEINGQGPVIPEEKRKLLEEKLDRIQEGDILVLAGSIPDTLPDSIYQQIMERLQGKRIKIVVDATKDLLANVLKYHPFLVKPNKQELGDLFGVTLHTNKEVIAYAKKMQEKGARHVLVSMAGEGAVFVGESGCVFENKAPKGTLVNSVGAGDSMVAGFLTGYLESGNEEKAFEMGIATGSASAFSEFLATREEAEAVLLQLKEMNQEG